MPSAVFEPATPTTKRPQTYALDRAATEVGNSFTGAYNQGWTFGLPFRGFLITHTYRHTPLDEWVLNTEMHFLFSLLPCVSILFAAQYSCLSRPHNNQEDPRLKTGH
jgi:hypothetical protein